MQSESATLAARRGDILATLFYYANWHFIAADESYFATFAGVSPLRHMWSLAIEEQFYLVWPIVILLALRFMRARLLLSLIVVGAILSAADLAYQYEAHNPSRAYFGTDARAHVLLVGSALALLTHAYPALLSHERAHRLARIAALPAAGAIVVGYVLMKDQAAFYYWGGSLLFACFVAVLIWTVEALPRSPVARAISIKPINWVGRISYSLYLWHWPVIIWISSFIAVNAFVQKGLAIAAMTAMAGFSFYVVERPIRTGRAPWLRLSTVRLAIAVSIALALFAAVTFKVTTTASAQFSDRPCPPGSPLVGTLKFCIEVNPTIAHPPVIITAGDSTSRALTPGLNPLAATRAWLFIQAGQDGCSFLPLDVVRTREFEAQQRTCAQDVPRLLSTLNRRYHPTVWLISDVFVLASLRAPDGTILAPGDSAGRAS